MRTALQHGRRQRREYARSQAWADKRARDVGYQDAFLFHPQNPYRADSPLAAEWQAGYQDGQREQAKPLKFGAA